MGERRKIKRREGEGKTGGNWEGK
jgi:hypothetical protein